MRVCVQVVLLPGEAWLPVFSPSSPVLLRLTSVTVKRVSVEKLFKAHIHYRNLIIISSGHLIHVGKHGLPSAPRHQETVNEADPPHIGITAIWHGTPAGHQAFPTHHVIMLWGSSGGRPHMLCVPDEAISCESLTAKRQQNWDVSRQMTLAWKSELCSLSCMRTQFCAIKEQIKSNRSVSGVLEAKSLGSTKTLLKTSQTFSMLLSI